MQHASEPPGREEQPTPPHCPHSVGQQYWPRRDRTPSHTKSPVGATGIGELAVGSGTVSVGATAIGEVAVGSGTAVGAVGAGSGFSGVTGTGTTGATGAGVVGDGGSVAVRTGAAT